MWNISSEAESLIITLTNQYHLEPRWRNWYTRTTQNRVPSGLRVQVPPAAPNEIDIPDFKSRKSSRLQAYYLLLKCYTVNDYG